jgi:hypothetical protein
VSLKARERGDSDLLRKFRCRLSQGLLFALGIAALGLVRVTTRAREADSSW